MPPRCLLKGRSRLSGAIKRGRLTAPLLRRGAAGPPSFGPKRAALKASRGSAQSGIIKGGVVRFRMRRKVEAREDGPAPRSWRRR